MVTAGLEVYLAFTAGVDNFREFPEVAQLGAELGVRKVWADRLVPTGQGAALQALSADQTREFMDILRRQLGRYRRSRTKIAANRALQFLAGGGNPYQCTAGRTLLTIMPNGDLMPCRRLPIVVGNVMRTPLAELYFGNTLLRQLRDPESIPEGCAHCFYKRLCRGGLRCLAYAVTGQTTAADPGCWRADHDAAADNKTTVSLLGA
jgi:radical SAM protein with 4Fe4S-binding SPASM domain